MGTAARARVEAEFSLASMVRRYEDIYTETVAGRPARQVQHGSERTGAEQSGVV